jgi:predicted nucleic acid-binding protein
MGSVAFNWKCGSGRRIPERFSRRILTIDTAVADRWGALVAETKRNGTPMATVDALLAATALEHDLAVVTRNESDFQKAHVPIVNPWEPA